VKAFAMAGITCLLLACEGGPTQAAGNEAQTAGNEAQAAPAAVAAQAPSSGDPQVDRLLAAISGGDEATVRKLVGKVGYLVARSGIVSTEDAFVERVLGCATESVDQVRAIVRYRVIWRCPARDGGEPVYYNAALGTSAPLVQPGDGIMVLEFTAGRTNPTLRAPVALPPAAPSAEKSGG
jgi:hypothetical protein